MVMTVRVTGSPPCSGIPSVWVGEGDQLEESFGAALAGGPRVGGAVLGGPRAGDGGQGGVEQRAAFGAELAAEPPGPVGAVGQGELLPGRVPGLVAFEGGAALGVDDLDQVPAQLVHRGDVELGGLG